MEQFLNELDSHLTENQLIFNCPVCPVSHPIRIGFKPGYEGANGHLWQRDGESIGDLTVFPSIHVPGELGTCAFTGRITGGMVIW